MKFEGVHCKSFSALHNQYILTNISALCAFVKFFWFRTIPNHMLKKHSKNQGSPMWCPWAPGRLQGPSRLSTGVAKRHGHQISSISCFALWEMLFEKKTGFSLPWLNVNLVYAKCLILLGMCYFMFHCYLSLCRITLDLLWCFITISLESYWPMVMQIWLAFNGFTLLIRLLITIICLSCTYPIFIWKNKLPWRDYSECHYAFFSCTGIQWCKAIVLRSTYDLSGLFCLLCDVVTNFDILCMQTLRFMRLYKCKLLYFWI